MRISTNKAPLTLLDFAFSCHLLHEAKSLEDHLGRELLGDAPVVPQAVVTQDGKHVLSQALHARMLIDRDGRDDRDKARELLTEAVAMYRKIGMPKHLEMAEALLGEL